MEMVADGRKQANTDQNQIPWPVSVRAAGQSWNAGFCNGTILSLPVPVPVSVPTRPNNEMAEQHFNALRLSARTVGGFGFSSYIAAGNGCTTMSVRIDTCG